MQQLLGHHWHYLPEHEVLDLLESDIQKGLDVFEIKHRQERFGPNVVTGRRGKSPLVRFLLQFNNPLIYILLIASVITLLIKDPIDAVVIFAVVFANSVLGYVQESRAEHAIEALAKTMTTAATVVRAGQTQTIPAAELVPGDIVLVKAGDKVPADIRLLRSRDLQVAEAALTGESAPVEKSESAELAHNTPLAERKNMLYASTLVTQGQGTGIVTATGNATEVGRISQLIASAEEIQTPLTRKIAEFSRLVLYGVLALTFVTFFIGLWRGQPVVETFTAAVALAVAMIPEGLPAALTVTLAIGVSRMAQRRAVIRRLPAVEALGSVTVICSDKTGTLTQNQMTVTEIVVPGATYLVTGVGYAPSGQILQEGQPLTPKPQTALWEALAAGLLCNDSDAVEKDGRWQAQGDPTEVALVVSARKAGLSAEALLEHMPRRDVLPFDSRYQYMATLHHRGPGQPAILMVKGAVEVILARSSTMMTDSGKIVPLNAETMHASADKMASHGLRVLAMAHKLMDSGTTRLTHDDVQGLTLLGLQGIIDPPRAEVIAAVATCRRAGVRVKMITGDHALTAAAIARQIGIGTPIGADGRRAVLSGWDIEGLSDKELTAATEQTDVFARVTPEQKLRLVEALQAQGQIVAMTGDGVNDGPALKQADIGVAMGLAGTDVAREAADMVLTDDNFATIEAAIEEGRGVFDNLTKIIAWTLPTNFGEGLIILAGLIAGTVLPILPLSILWINLMTSVALGLVLAVELKEPDTMARPPRNPQAPILTAELALRVAIVAVLILIGAFGLFEVGLAAGADVARARTVAVNVVVFVEIFYLLNCRSLSQSVLSIGLFSNRWMIVGVTVMVVLQLIYTYAPVMHSVFRSAPMSAVDWLAVVAWGFVSYVVIEVQKLLSRRRRTAPAFRQA